MQLNTVYNENCVETLSRMPDGFLDMTLTSPPYDDLRKYNGYTFPFEEIAQGLFRATKVGGVVVWVVGDRTVDGDESGTSFKQALYFKSIGFKLWDTMIFAKNNPIPGDCGDRYRQTFEYIFAFSKGSPKTFNPIERPSASPGKSYDQFRLEREGRNYYGGTEPIIVGETRKAGNIFHYSVGQNGDSREYAVKHPAVYPESLANDQIISWSNEGDIVYDPFMGSGTTGKMAHLLNREWLGSEISEEYAALATERIRAETELPLFDAFNDPEAAAAVMADRTEAVA